jgi:hypothetical protein
MIVIWVLDFRSVDVGGIREVIVELVVSFGQQGWQQLQQDRLQHHSAVHYHDFSADLLDLVDHHPSALEYSQPRLGVPSERSMQQHVQRFGSTMFEVRPQVEHHVDGHLEPLMDVQKEPQW